MEAASGERHVEAILRAGDSGGFIAAAEGMNLDVRLLERREPAEDAEIKQAAYTAVVLAVRGSIVPTYSRAEEGQAAREAVVGDTIALGEIKSLECLAALEYPADVRLVYHREYKRKSGVGSFWDVSVGLLAPFGADEEVPL